MAIPVAAVSFAQIYSESRVATADEGIRISLGKTSAMFVAQDLPSPCLMQDPKAPITADGPFLVMQSTDEEGYLKCVEAQDGKSFTDPRTLGLKGEWIVEERTPAYVTVEKRLVPVEVVIGEAWNPALEGRYHSLQGETPKQSDQVLVTSPTLERLGVQVGDFITLDAGSQKLQIVGTLESNNDADKQGIIFAASSLLTLAPEYNSDGLYYSKFFLNSDEPVEWDQLVEYNTLGLAVLSRDVAMNPPANENVPLYQSSAYWTAGSDSFNDLLGTVWLFVALLFPVGALSGSAFAFGVRRQARNLAVIASLGASSRMLKLVNIMSGLWLGILGSIAGLLGGFGIACWRLAAASDGSAWSYPGFHVPWDSIAVAVVFGVAFGVIFSVVPAIRASKVDIQSQLRGTRSEGNPRVRGGLISLLMILVGGVLLSLGGSLSALFSDLSPQSMTRQLLPLAIFGGGMIAALGLMLGAVWILRAVHLVAGRISGPGAYALRDLIFNNKRYVPVISSILAVVFVGSSVSLMTFHFAKESEAMQFKSMESNQVMVDVASYIPSLRNSSWGLSREEVSERIASSGPLLESTVENLLDAGAIGATLLQGQPRPGYSESPTEEIAQDAWFGRVKFPMELICPWDERNPDFDDYEAASSAQDYETIGELDTKWAGCGTQLDPSFALALVGDSDDLIVATAGKASQEALEALEAGQVVAFSKDWIVNGEVSFEFIDPRLSPAQTPERVSSADAYLEPVDGNRYSVMMNAETAKTLGLFFEPVSISAYFANPVTEPDLESLRYILGEAMEYDATSTVWSTENIAWALAAAMAALVLLIALIAIGLAQIESRADRGALWSVGASRWYRSRVVALEGFLLSLIGVGLGLLIGSSTAVAMLQLLSLGEELQPNIPVAQLVSVLIGVPVLVALVSAIFGSGKLTRKRSALD